MYELAMLLNTLVWLAMVVYFVTRPGASIFHPLTFYLAFHFLVFVARAPLVYYRGYDFIYKAYQFNPTIEEKTKALLAATLGLVAFGITILNVGKSPMVFRRTEEDEKKRARMIVPLLITAAIVAPLGLYSLYLSWQSDVSGTSNMIMDAATKIAINTSSSGYIYESRLMLGPVGVAFAWLFRFRWFSFLPLVAFIFLASGTGTRGPFVLALVAVFLIWLYEQRLRWPNWRVVGPGIVAILLFSAVGLDRGAAVRQILFEDTAVRNSYTEEMRFLEGMDFGNLQYLEYLVYAVPHRTGTYSYFVENLQLFTEPIPRALWPGKPVGQPIRFYSLFDYGYPIGMTNSVPGAGYQALGFLGVILWASMFGYIWGRIYEAFVARHQSNIKVLGFMIFLPLSMLAFRDGTLLSIARFGMFLVFPVLLLWFLSRTGTPVRDSGTGHARMTPAQRRRALAAQLTEREE